MKLKCWPRYLANYASSWCRDAVSPAYPTEEITADFFVSMGTHCRPALNLRRCNLRITSSPLDWMMNYTLKDAAELFKTGFSNFFADIKEHPTSNAKHRHVEDLSNGMISPHHFPFSLSLEDGQKILREKAGQRFASTHRFMSDSERFVMLTNSAESIDGICHFITEIHSLYPAEIIHINIRDGTKKEYEKITLHNNAVLYYHTFGEEHDASNGNRYEWNRIMQSLHRTSRFRPSK